MKLPDLDLQGIDLVLVRGAQGAGKSTMAKYLAETQGYLQLEPDDFFHAGPFYYWDSMWLRTAHTWNAWRTERALCDGKKVVVAETFYKREHLNKYTALTPHHKVIRMTGQYPNVHAVPQEVVEQVRADMQPYNGELIIPNSDFWN